MQLSELIGTLILSPDGEKLGYVKEAFLSRDATALSCLVAVDGEEEEFILPARAVLAAKDAVIAGRGRLSAPTGTPSPMGRAVFSEEGEYLGAVTDVTVADPPAVTVTRDGAAQTYPLTRVAVGETVILYAKERKKRAAAKKAPQKAPQKAQGEHAAPRFSAPHPAENGENADAPMPAVETQAYRSAQADAPNAFCLNRYNLLGRRVKKSVFDAFGLPVALAGERVTPEMLASARKRNRLLALTVNTLTNLP